MSEMSESTLCEKFEANVFAKTRCQNCFRTVTAHKRGNQVSLYLTLVIVGRGGEYPLLHVFFAGGGGCSQGNVGSRTFHGEVMLRGNIPKRAVV
uniref:Uncharacterized protein n=1 Tax=Podarcis muralis TaxID=64176 RepID=A0A670IRY9_PODMU